MAGDCLSPIGEEDQGAARIHRYEKNKDAGPPARDTLWEEVNALEPRRSIDFI